MKISEIEKLEELLTSFKVEFSIGKPTFEAKVQEVLEEVRKHLEE